MWKNFSLGRKLGIGLGLPFLVIGLSIIVTFVLVLLSRGYADLVKSESAPFAGIARQMRLDVVQVQQWLTDISATRGRDGLDDGFKQAARSAASFRAGLAKFRKMYAREQDQRGLRRIGEISRDFDRYYAAGTRMAKAYIDGGPAKGNKMMGAFDKAAEALNKALGPFIKQQMDELNDSMASITSSLGLIALVLILVVLALIGSVFVGWLVVRAVTRPVKELAQVAEAIAEGDYDAQVNYESKDEIGQLVDSLRHMVEKLVTGLGEGQSIKDGIAVPFWTADRNLTLTFVNNAFKPVVEARTGRQVDQVVGNMNVVDVIGEQTARMARASIEQQKAFTEEITLEIGGEERFILGTTAHLDDLNGEIFGIMGIGIDITRQKRQQRDLTEVARDVSRLAEQLASAATEVSASTEEMAASSDEQSAQAETVASSTEEMSAAVQEAAKNAGQGADTAQKSAQVAREGGDLAAQTVKAINQISENAAAVGQTVRDLAAKAEMINSVVEVIEDIADQTNLLALNAAIEAARAGEAGRGFAVVADEVRKLAEKTMTATKEVGATVRAIQDSNAEAVSRMEDAALIVDNGVSLANQTGDKLGQIVDQASAVGQMVTQIATAAEEQTVATEEITRNVEGIANAAKESANAVAETARTAEELSSMAVRLQETVARFKE